MARLVVCALAPVLALVGRVGPSTAIAQEFRATLTGHVADSSGLPLPSATISITEVASAATRTTSSGVDGSFTAPLLPPGIYVVRAALEGFKTFSSEPLLIEQMSRVAAPSCVLEEATGVPRTAARELVRSSVNRIDARLRRHVDDATARSPLMLATLPPGITHNGLLAAVRQRRDCRVQRGFRHRDVVNQVPAVGVCRLERPAGTHSGLGHRGAARSSRRGAVDI